MKVSPVVLGQVSSRGGRTGAADSRPVPGQGHGGERHGGSRPVAVVVEVVAAAGVAVLVAVAGITVVSSVRWPAYTTSNVLRALTTVGQVAAIAALCAAVALTRARVSVQTDASGRQWTPRWVRLLSWIGISGFVAITLGMPLAASNLYLLGLSPDQQWRSELLGRFADSAGWRDGTYAGLPPDRTAGWYWLGGRLAAVAETPGWEALKLYAITSIAVAAVLALVWWSRLLRRADIAIVVAAATTAVAVTYAAADPALATCLLLLTPALVATWSALDGSAGDTTAPTGFTRRAASSRQVWARLSVVVAYLGGCAAFDEAAFVIAASAVAVVALLAGVVAVKRADAVDRLPRWRGVLGRWLVVAAAAAIAVTLVWSAYLSQRGTAMFTEIEISAAEWGAAVRVVSAAAAVLVAIVAIRAGFTMVSEPRLWGRVVTAVGLIGAIGFCQRIPDVLAVPIGAAYRDTDGRGLRADGYPVSAVAEYWRVDQAIVAATRVPRRDSVVLTGDTTLLAIYPYSGYLAQSARYSNPLADYDSRVRQVEHWSALSSSDELIAELDRSPHPAPTVYVLRRSGSDYLLRLASDPSSDNGLSRTYTTISFPVALFDNEHFTRTEAGPFAVLVRR
ncbi:arabinofuranosyltransferase [Nocardia abscessus]|uniref:arabinofuranosyltransferase n=1 Tax=Nocardia abscessus TaxID=120957 RepID=UPI002455C541|nr:arabinofuranosyltransferase [Nocardia abscessus]